MLKQWLASGGDLQAIDVEEKYCSWVSSLRTDRYTTAAAPVLSKVFELPIVPLVFCGRIMDTIMDQLHCLRYQCCSSRKSTGSLLTPKSS